MWLNKVVLALLLATINVHASDRYVTLTALGTETNFLEVAEGEIAELVSFPEKFNSIGSARIYHEGTILTETYRGGGNFTVSPYLVAGPVRIGLYGGYTRGLPQIGIPVVKAFCTIRISPQTYPPTGTVVIPPGPGGGILNLECSTDLVTWQSAANGVYINEPTAKFFRLDLQRIFSPQVSPPPSFSALGKEANSVSRPERIITWIAGSKSGGSEFEIPSGQTLRLRAVMGYCEAFTVIKDGLDFRVINGWPEYNTPTVDPLVIAGPARIKVITGREIAYTFEMLPSWSDPQTTVIVPPGAAGGRIQLQLSTNLLDWVSANPGIYTNLPAAYFWRISLERISN